MKQISGILLSFLTLLVIVGCTATKKPAAHVSQPSDTLYTEEAASEIYGYQPERALLIIDSAVIVGNMSEHRAQVMRAMVYSRSLEMFKRDTAIIMCENLLQDDSVKADREQMLEVYDLLIQNYRLRGDFEKLIHWATEKSDYCRSLNMNVESLRTDAEIGIVLTNLGEVQKGLDMLDDVIRKLDNVRHFEELDAAIIAMKRKINVLSTYYRFAEVIPVAERILTRLADYEQHPGDYADDGPRHPRNDAQRVNYIDFYRAQAYAFLSHAYAELDNVEKSQAYAAQFEQSQYGKSLSGRRVMTNAWFRLKEYDKMLSAFDDLQREMGADTLCASYAIMLHHRAVAASDMGHNAASQDYWHRYSYLSKLLSDSLLLSKSHDYAARYDAQNLKLKAQREEARSDRYRIIALSVAAFALVAFGIAVYTLRMRREMAKKNRVLAEQISESVDYKHKYEEIRKELRQQSATAEPDVPDLPFTVLNNMSNEDLFHYLSGVIVDEQLFLDPDFCRQTLADRFHLSDHRIGAAFAQGSEHKSLPNFIRENRLQYACQLLQDKPEMSVVEIAAASGFSNTSVFSRDFKKKFMFAPTLYRELRKK